MKNLAFIFCVVFMLLSFTKDEKPIIYKVSNSKEISLIDEEEHESEFPSESELVNLSNSEGSITSDLSVNASGGLNYSIPIQVPPGLNGVVPEVSLDFDSHTGRGMAGWGWNVSGISVITRIPSTKFHDDQIDPVDFDTLDRFALDGQRLIAKTGSYGGDGTVYQTEQYSNLKIISYDSHPTSGVSGPESFKVFYPDGSIGYYGVTTGSRSRMDYALSYWENPQGIRITYNYNFNRISSITYGSKGDDPYVNRISFSYLTGSIGVHKESAWIGGENFETAARLDKIEVYGKGDALYRKYEFVYDKTIVNYLRLRELKEYPSTGSNRSITFEYGNTNYILEEIPNTATNLSISSINRNNTSVVSGDLSGNGKMDFILYPTTGPDTKNKFWVFDDIQSASGMNYADGVNIGLFEELFTASWLNDESNLMPGQGLVAVQNNGSKDVKFTIMAKEDGGPLTTQYTKVWNAPGVSYQLEDCSTTYQRIARNYLSGDFDGDGLTDVIAISKGENDSRVCYPNSGGGGNCNNCSATKVYPKTAHLIKLDRRLTTSTDFATALGQFNQGIGIDDKLFAVDVTGDGRTNIVLFKDNHVYVYGLDENNDSLIEIWDQNSQTIDVSFPILSGDFNGDGKVDFLLPQQDNSTDFRMFFSKGGGAFEIESLGINDFAYKPNITNGTPKRTNDLLPIDINGDGKTDILEYTTVTYANGTGSQFITPHLTYGAGAFLKLDTETRFGALNDYPIPIFLSSNQPNNNLDFGVISNKLVRSFRFGLDHREDMMLEKVSNNGVSTTITYDPVDTGYDGGGNFPGYTNSYFPKYGKVYPFVNVNVAPTFKVVRRLDQTASGIDRAKLFYYEGAVSHTTGLGFQGFETVKRSSWFGDNVFPLWTITKRNPILRGVVTEQIVANTSDNDPATFQSKVNYFYDYKLIANPTSPSAPDYLENITRNTSLPGAQTDEAEESITLLPGFHSIGSNGVYFGQIVPPNEQPGGTGYAGAVDIRLNRLETNNGLNGVLTTETYAYDEYNNPLVTTTSFPGGSRVLTYIYSNNASAINNTYHIGKPLKLTERLTLNGSSFATEEEYTYNNNLVTSIRRKGDGTDWITQELDYDSYGNIKIKTLKTAGPEADRIQRYTYGYDERFLIEYTDIDGLKTIFSYEAATGLLKSTTEASTADNVALTTAYGHDQWGRITTETDYLGNVTQYGTQYQQDGGTVTTIDYPQGSKTESTYNAFGWEIRTGTLSLNNEWSYTSYKYDASGRLIQESEPHGQSPNQWNITNFDEYSRVISQQLYTGRTITATYTNGSLISTVNDGVKNVTTTLDALGNTIKVTDPGGTVDYTYHASGQLKSADYGGNVVTVGVDGWGRKTSLNDPSAGTYTYAYNNWGELTEQTSPKGTTTYAYDPEGKVTSKTITGDHTDLLLSYQYVNSTKQLKKITGTDNYNSGRSYVYEYTYDTYKRPLKITEDTGQADFEYEVTYDPVYGRVWKEKQTTNLAGGISKTLTTRNGYDGSGILSEIWNDGTPDKLWELDEINERGQELTVNLGNGITQTKSYDAYGYLQEIEDKETGNNPTTALHTEYDFNVQRGILNSRENFGFSWQETFAHDNQDRLTSITGDVTHTKTYLNNGNIDTNEDLGDYEYGDASKKYRLTEIDPNTAGESYFQQHPTQQINYNAFKKPVEIHQQGHGRVSFEYGPLMNRSTAYYGGEDQDKTARRYKKHYSAIIPVEIVEDAQAGTTKIVTYVGGDAYTAPIVHIKTTGAGAVDEYHYLHRDYLGSILAITDADGDVKEERQFGAWGAVDQFLDSGGDTTFDHTALLGRGYTGHEHFFEVGLIHMNGRMYDAHLGRFLSPDNYIQEPFNTQSYNRYGYVLNNPLSYIDPSGEFFDGGFSLALVVKILIGAIIVDSFLDLGIFSPPNVGYTSNAGSGSAPTPGNVQNNTTAASSMASSGRRSAFNDGGVIPLNIPAVDAGGNAINYTLDNNFSYQNVSVTGISQVGRADPLQGVTRPEGWEYNPTADAAQFSVPESEGFTITTEDIIDTTLDFIPIAGGVNDIRKGIRDGDGWQVALGAGIIILDIFTLGGSSLAKGVIKTGIKAGGKTLARKTARKTLKKGAKARRTARRRAAAESSILSLEQFSKSTIDSAVELVTRDSNKLGHLFAPKHNLTALVNKLGGQENTVRAILNAANGKLPSSGVFNNIPVNIGGQTIFIRGNVINGIPRLGTFFIP